MIRMAFVALACCTQPGLALAYIDPGSSLLALQGLLALMGALVVIVRHPVRVAKALWRRLFPGKKDDG